jgi:nitrous oxidase accessory protein NosD
VTTNHGRIVFRSCRQGLLAVAVLGLVVAASEESRAGGIGASRRTITIRRPGSYRLHHNVTPRHGPAIVVAASGVTLDLGGHALVGSGDKDSVGVVIWDVANVAVRNGTISGFGFGVKVVDSLNVRVEKLQISGKDQGGPPPGEVGILVMNSRAVEIFRNVINRTFLGVFVRGGGSGGNRIAENTVTAGANGQLGICYNPDGLGTMAGPSGDLVYDNSVSGFNLGFQTSAESHGNVFRDNTVAFVMEAINELSPPGANLFEDNLTIALP